MTGMGIDRIALAFPVTRFAEEESSWGTVSSIPPSRGVTLAVHGARVFVAVGMVRGAWWGRFEFNPSRVVDPHGVSICSVDQLHFTVAEVWPIVLSRVTPALTLEESRLKRLDVTRDFEGIQRPELYLRGLATLPRPYARAGGVYLGRRSGRVLTLEVGNRHNVVRLYDKHDEHPGLTTEGHLRWEAECRSWAITYGAMRLLADVTPERVESLVMNRWEWSGMGMKVTDPDAIVAFVEGTGWSDSAKSSFLGDLWRMSRGRPPSMSNDRKALFRRRLTELGVVPSPHLLSGQGLGFTARLDFDTGTEVIDAA